MLEITGGASATALAFIFPAACYLKLADPHAPWYARTTALDLQRCWKRVELADLKVISRFLGPSVRR